ncbi:hypothetical protein QQG55_15355 [Brugia pahangi]
MVQIRCIGTSSIIYFTLFVGLFVLTTFTNANVINEEDDEPISENAKHWYPALLRSEPQFGFERGSRSHGKPTFIRFGKRYFDAYNPNLFNNK